MSRGKGYQPGPHKFQMEVDADLNLDLHAFCEVFYGAPKVEITRRALARFIQKEIEHAGMEREFEDTRRRLAEREGLTLIAGTPRTSMPDQGEDEQSA